MEANLLNELSAPSSHAVQNEILKKEILQRLNALKRQYREDLENLTKRYEVKREALKEALLKLSEGELDVPRSLSRLERDSKPST